MSKSMDGDLKIGLLHRSLEARSLGDGMESDASEIVINGPQLGAVEFRVQLNPVRQSATLPTTFYVKDVNGNLVAAQFLSVNGSTVKDPNSYDSNVTLYTASGISLGLNTNGYLLVPNNYSLSSAGNFASVIYSIGQPVEIENGALEINNLPGMIGAMATAFTQGGAQDIQRTYNGLSNAPAVTAFVDAASYTWGL